MLRSDYALNFQARSTRQPDQANVCGAVSVRNQWLARSSTGTECRPSGNYARDVLSTKRAKSLRCEKFHQISPVQKHVWFQMNKSSFPGNGRFMCAR